MFNEKKGRRGSVRDMENFVSGCQEAASSSKLDIASCPPQNRLSCSVKGDTALHFSCVNRTVEPGEIESCLPATHRGGGARMDIK